MLFRRSGSVDPGTEGSPGETALSALFSESIKAADAYAAVRRAIRVEGEDLRVGNLFTRADRLKEIAFVAAGNAAVPMATALVRSLGEIVTQGLVIGPEAPPDSFPFRSRIVKDPALPSPEGVVAAGEALELAAGLGRGDLLVPLISPGALGVLGLPPSGLDVEAYRSLLQEIQGLNIDLEGSLAVPRALSRTQGGKLAAAAGEAIVEALVVDRGDGGAQVGAGPTARPPATTGTRAREILERIDRWATLPSNVRDLVLAPPVLAGPSPASLHTVVVAGPDDALDGAGVEAASRHHRPKLVLLHDTSPPDAAAHRLLEALEAEIPRPRDKKSTGVAVFSGLTLGCSEGEESSQRLEEFLKDARHLLKRREVTVGVFYTGGSLRPAVQRPVGFVNALEEPTLQEMKGGFTDVGMIAVAWYDAPGATTPSK